MLFAGAIYHYTPHDNMAKFIIWQLRWARPLSTLLMVTLSSKNSVTIIHIDTTHQLLTITMKITIKMPLMELNCRIAVFRWNYSATVITRFSSSEH